MWHRKAHKTTLAVNELIRRAVATKGTYWYVAPLRDQAKKIVWQDPEMFPKYCPPEIWDKRNNSDLTIPFPNGSIIYVLGANDPDSLRGPNPKGVILDEYGDMKAETWSGIVQPIMIANPKAWTWFIGTPKGRNDFYQKMQFAKQESNWYFSMLKASESGIISSEGLLEAQRSTTQAFYDQEYECEFLEGAGQFFRRIRQNTYNALELTEAGDFHLGVDLAKYQDWTVLTPFNLNTFTAYPQDRFQQVDWNLQKARIEATALRYQNARVKIDATGVGDPIVEDLKARGLNITDEDAIKFTEVSRANLLNHLSMLLEQDKIKIPSDEGLIEELESFRYTLTQTGKIRVGAPENLHDDRVMSLALAVNGVREPIPLEYDGVTRNPRFASRDEGFSLYNQSYD